MIKKYSVLICLTASVIFLVIATLNYPGGSIVDKDSIGFDWTKNFFSNLFSRQALNGAENHGWIWAIIGMVFNSVGFGIFFINMSKKMPSKVWAGILKYIGVVNIVFIFLIATPMHDLGVISIVLTLLGLFVVTLFVLLSKLHFLKVCCIICLLTYYGFFTVYGLGYLSLAIIMQKVYIVSSILLVVILEYFTKRQDFIPVKSGEKKAKTIA